MNANKIIDFIMKKTKETHYSYQESTRKCEKLRAENAPKEQRREEAIEHSILCTQAATLENVLFPLLRMNKREKEIHEYLEWTRTAWKEICNKIQFVERDYGAEELELELKKAAAKV